MDKPTYHATLKTMQDAGVDMRYYHGWASGALENTPLEEQRVTEAYTAGYEDGKSGSTEGYKQWLSAES
jgi:hypothetical protein